MYVETLPLIIHHKMCSLTTECVLLLRNVFPYYIYMQKHYH